MSSTVQYSTGLFLLFLSLIVCLILNRRYEKQCCRVGEDNTFFYDLCKRKWMMEFFLFLFAFSIFRAFSKNAVTPYNNYFHLANAWLHGRLDVPELPSYLESIQFNGKTYVHFAPGATLLVLPLVAIYGISGLNNILICNILGAFNVALCWRVLSRWSVENKCTRLWLTLLMGFGTVHFWCSSWGSSWLLGHISVLFYLLIAFCFLFRKNQKKADDFLSGLFFGLAVCCRLSALFGGIFFAGYILMNREKKWKSLFLFACGALVFGSLYMLYNFVRFGTIMDMSYHLTYLKDYHREVYDSLQAAPYEDQLSLLKRYSSEYGGPLQLRFFVSNLRSLFTELPSFHKDFPHIRPELAGVCITLCSPALFLAFLCKWKKPVNLLLWGTTIATAVPFLLNYGNGFAQFGMRYSMDFTPYLFLLCCDDSAKMTKWKQCLILFSVFVNAWGALYWKCFM